MTDLRGKCPHCGAIVYRYLHNVDHFGMGVEASSGKYKMICEPSGYRNDDKKPEKYCGKKFAIRISQKVEVLKK